MADDTDTITACVTESGSVKLFRWNWNLRLSYCSG